MRICQACLTRFSGAGWRCPNCSHAPPDIAGFPAFAPQLAVSNNDFDAGSHAILDRLQASNFWFRARNRLIGDLVGRFFPKSERVLEVGCGTGFVLQALQGALPRSCISGADVYSASLAFAAQRVSNIQLFQADIGSMPYVDEFDLVCAFDVLEHVDDDRAALAGISRTLTRNGGVILAVPQHPALWSQADEYARHKRRYRRGELIEKCREAGFKIAWHSSFVSILLPFMAMHRWRGKAMRQFDPVKEFSMPRSLNRLFESVLDLERIAIRAGFSFPFGGSCFVVARKSLSAEVT